MAVHDAAAADALVVGHVEVEILRQRVVNPGALEVFVDPEVRCLVVVVRQHIGSAGYGGMAVVSGVRIQNGLLQQLRGIQGLLDLRILVSDIDAVSVSAAQIPRPAGIDLAAGRDHGDRIGHAQEQARLKEVRQEIVVQRNRQLMVVQHADARQIGQLPGDVLVVSQDVLRAVDLPADLLNLRAHHQQQGKRVVPRGDRRPVAVIQIVVQAEEVGFVPYVVLDHHRVFHHGFVDQIDALVLIPVHQVVSVNQRPHINVGRVVSEHLRKEIALRDGCMPDSQLIRIFDFRRGFPAVLRRNRLRAFRHRGPQHAERQDRCQYQRQIPYDPLPHDPPFLSLYGLVVFRFAGRAPAAFAAGAAVLIRSSLRRG